jgi:phage/plasmid-like protein (TIGR03299 family)
MSHAVENMAYAQKTPWHGLGVTLETEDLYDWPRTCAKAGLDWAVELAPLQTADTLAAVDHKAVRRLTDGRTLGVVGPHYTPLQNRDAFAWFQPFLDAGEASLHTAGSLHQGRRVWVLAKLGRAPLEIAPGDEVEKFLLLSNGHDGGHAVRIGFTPTRVVCANTLAMALGDKASKLIRVAHCRSVRADLDNVREVMNLADQSFEAAAEQYRRLARRGVNAADLRRYVQTVLQPKEGEELTDRLKAVIDQVVGLAEQGRGNALPSVRGTLWAAYNGVAEWLAYRRGRTQESRLGNLWFGEAAGLNRHALETALEMAV